MLFYHRRATAHVDHRNPIHDGVCRCRACKPALVGQRPRVSHELIAAAIVLVPVGLIVWGFAYATLRLSGKL